MPGKYDIIINGLGPTGATLANLLGQCDLKILVLEREADVYNLPRAVHFDDEVMRVFQNIAVADAVEKTSRFNPGMQFVDANGNLLLDWPRPPGRSSNGWFSSYRFHQPDLEKILRSGLNRFPQVEYQLQTELQSVLELENSVQVTATNLSTGFSLTHQCQYLIGCDGANSTVRQLMKTSLTDYGFRERWLVVDAILKRPRPDLGDCTIQHCNPGRPTTYVRCPGNRRRWEMALQESEDTDDVCKAESVWQFLRPWITPDDATLERRAVYTFQSATAKQWRKGRLFLAGDAAHLMPPFMGQGMCTGIRDAANLAWKLAHCCLNDLESEERHQLLDSYESERLPHAIQFINTSIALGGLMNDTATTGDLSSGLLSQDGSSRMKSPTPRLGKGLSIANSNCSGTVFPQPELTDGILMDDKAPYQFLLICEQSFWDDCGYSSNQPGAGLLLLCTETESDLRPVLETLECKAVLVRPDRYVLGTANNVSEMQALCNFRSFS